MYGSRAKRRRLYGSIDQKSNTTPYKHFDDLSESSNDDLTDQNSSSELSDIKGDTVELDSQILQGLEESLSDEAGSTSSRSEREDSKDLTWPSGTQEVIGLKQSVDIEDIEHTRKEGFGQSDKDGKKLLEEAEISLTMEDSPQDLHHRLKIHEELTDIKEQFLEKLSVHKKYKLEHDLPKILTSSDLIEKIQPLLRIVRDMYRGVVDSYYKFEATLVSKKSKDGILSLKEFRSLDIDKFLAGFYGFKRQLLVGEEILRQFKSFLLKRQGETMRWWGVNDFANYVLAPEVLASLCIQEMNLGRDLYDKDTREKAYELFDKTVEYGIKVADTDPLEDWEIEVEEDQLKACGLDPTLYSSTSHR